MPSRSGAYAARPRLPLRARPFDSKRYALLFLVLASLEAAGSRTTLTVLFDQVRIRAGDVDPVAFDHNLAADRRAFVHAVQALVDLGVLELADGGEESFATAGAGAALYRVERDHLTGCSRSPLPRRSVCSG
ncbi:MAG: DUF2398 family protein [Nocardioidaceae bacterium]